MKRIFSIILLCLAASLWSEQLVAQEQVDASLDSLLNMHISTAGKTDQTINEAPASVSIITSEDIERFGYRTLEEVFQSVRGFYVSNDRNYSYVGVRGFGRPTDYNSRVLLLINGHTTNDNMYSGALVGTEFAYDFRSIDRIEIVRGPGSVLYGTGAMFAVVNIITQKGNLIDGVSTAAEVGNFGRKQAMFHLGKETGGGLDFTLSGEWMDEKGADLYFKEFYDPATNFGIARGLDWDKNVGFHGTATYGDFSFQVFHSWRNKGIPTGAWGWNFDDPFTHTVDNLRFIELKYEGSIASDKTLMVRGYYDYYYYFDEGRVGNLIVRDENTGKWGGGEAQFRWDIWEDNRLTAGVEYRNNPQVQYKLWDDSTMYFDRDVPYSTWSLYVQNEYQVLENLKLTLGIRRDEYSTVGSSTTPRAALVFNPFNGSTLKLLYGEAFRAPNFNEVYFETPLSGYKGNTSIQPEKIQTTELIWEQRITKGLFGTAGVYNYRMVGLIDEVLDPVDSLYVFRNKGNVHAIGIELELNARLESGHRAYASYTYQRAKDGDLDTKLTNSPAHALKVGFSVPIGGVLFAAAEIFYESGRLTLHDAKTDGYWLTNVRLSTPRLLDYFKFGLTIRNLFEVAYKTPGGFEHVQDAIIQDGRTLAFRIEAGF